MIELGKAEEEGKAELVEGGLAIVDRTRLWIPYLISKIDLKGLEI